MNTDQDTWAVKTLSDSMGEILVRYNDSAKKYAGEPEYSIKLAFAIPFGEIYSEKEFLLELEKIEDILLSEVEKTFKHVFAFIVTNSEMREFVFYIPHTEDINQSISETHSNINKKIGPSKIQCMAKHEPNWDSYKQFVGL